MNTDNTVKQHASLFDLDGVPKMSQAIPLALQHVVAMIVGCVTPAIIISGAAGIDTADRVLLIQASLVVSALATLLQLFPIGNKNSFHLGAGLPVILGVSFAYVPSMQAIAYHIWCVRSAACWMLIHSLPLVWWPPAGLRGAGRGRG